MMTRAAATAGTFAELSPLALGGDLEPGNLLALHALLEERHVTRAAARLGITQSSMSHRLRRLREALRDPLLVRDNGALALTPRAQAMIDPLAAALASLAAVVKPPVDFDPRTARGLVEVAMPDVLTPLVPALLAALATDAPGIQLRVSSVPAALAEGLAKGEPAMALAPARFVPEATRSRSLGQLFFGVVGRRGHPAFARPLTVKRWLEHRHVIVKIGNERSNPIEEALVERGLERRVGLEVNSFLAGLHVVADSDLLINAPLPLVREVATKLGLEVREPPFALPAVRFALLWSERYDAAPLHRWARKRVFDAARALIHDARA